MPSNVNVARGLSVSGDERALTFTELDGTVAEAFHDANIMLENDLVKFKDLAPGASSDDFPIFGDSPEDAEHHVPGQFIEGGTINQTKVNIAVDDDLIKALRLPIEDVALSKWDLVEPYAREVGRIIAEKIDNRAIRLGVLAARSSSVSNVHAAGKSVERTAASLSAAYPNTTAGADALLSDLSDMAKEFDLDNIPEDGRWAIFPTELRQVLTRAARIVNSDFNGAMGNVATRDPGNLIEGWMPRFTNHMPSTNITNDLSKYNGDFTYNGATGQPAVLCMYKGNVLSPIGGVRALGMRNVVYWDENRHVWVIKSSTMMGLGKLHVWCAGEIRLID